MTLAAALAMWGCGLATGSVARAATAAPVLPMALWGTVATAAGAPVTQGKVQAFLEGVPAGGDGASITASGAFGGGNGTLAPDLDIAGTGAQAGQALFFTVGGMAAAVKVVSCIDASAQPSSDNPVVWESGYFCQVALTVAGQPPTAPLTDSLAAGTTPGQQSVTVGGSGTLLPDYRVTASGGTGTAAIGAYSSDPEGGAPTPFQAGGSFFDVSLSPDSSFTTATVQACGASAGQSLYWWDGSAWTPVAPQSVSGDCVLAVLSATSSPTVAQLSGTPFALAVPAGSAVVGGGGVVVGGGVPAAPVAGPPVVSGLVPATGPAAGGTTVVISGHGFTGATRVDFGAIPAASFMVAADDRITAVSPPGSPGATVDVTVTTPAGTSATGSGDAFVYAAGAAQNAVAFRDVPSTSWAYPYIEALAARGIVNGFPGGIFRPDQAVTRAQFVKMLDLTLGLRPGGPRVRFRDVPAAAWYAPYVAAAVQRAIVKGTSPTTFSPDKPITREEMAVLLARALRLRQKAKLHFRDGARIGAWALLGVEEAVQAGYIDGFPDGTFRPLAATTRAQAAKVLAMVLHRPAATATRGRA